MNRTFTLQRQHNNNNSTRRGYDSVVLDNNTTTTEESVTKGEEKEKRNNKKILLVDDEPDITFTLKTLLEENGFKEVDVYNEPLLALQNFKSRVYSLLVTDVVMPRMDGFELYKHVKKIDDRINVIFVTASEINYEALNELSQVGHLDISDDKDKAAILQDGRKGDEERIHFIRKPVEIKEFIQRVTKELQRESVGLEQIGGYKVIEYKQIEQQQHQ
jgi:CheY-like chemotaxis protein